MRICLLADAQSIHIRQLTKALCQEGHSVHIVTHKMATFSGATVERFSVPPVGVGNVRRWVERRRKYLHGLVESFDIVNIHFLMDWGFDPAAGDWDHGCVVVTPWGSDIIDPPGEIPATPSLRQLRTKMLHRADAITVCGPSFAQTVADYAELGLERIQVVPFGVDCHLFRRLTSASPETPTATFFKGFRAVYGPDTVVRAIPQIRREFPEAFFRMIGDGPTLLDCKHLAREIGVEGAITWLPRQAHARLPHILADCAISIMPSIHEAFGVAALESSALGIPVVASDVCGFRDTVHHGETGLLVPVANPERLAEAVTKLLADKNLRQRFGDCGRSWVMDNYDWTKLARKWTEVYSRVLDQKAIMV